MHVELKLFATFRQTVGAKRLDRDLPADATVGDLLEGLEAEYEGLAGRLLADDGLAPQINVLRNGREVLHMDGPETTLDEGDTVAIFPPVAGGHGRG